MRALRPILLACLPVTAAWISAAAADKIDSKHLVTGPAAFGNAPSLKPGTYHKITAADLPAPFATESSRNNAKMVPRPNNAWPQAPAGFQVDLYVTKLDQPRKILTAPNGDFFVADSRQGAIQIFRGRDADGRPMRTSTFAKGLRQPFGIAFYPAGANPQWVYVGNTNSVVRFAYRNGDMEAAGHAETVVPELPAGGGHWTRDLAVSKDGKSLFVAVGSASNINDPDSNPNETHRANILEYTPDGKFVGVYASGIRNPVGLGINPATGELWCSTNERDALGDNLVPDYITHVQRGGFYGWPYYYIGNHPDPRLEGKHPELKDKVIVPDVLMTPHNASLALTFLRRYAVSAGIPRRSVCGRARVLESVDAVRLRSGARASGRRPCQRRVSGFSDGFRAAERRCVGPAGGGRSSPGRRVDGDRRRIRIHLAHHVRREIRSSHG